MPFVSFVGAGPGEADLITREGAATSPRGRRHRARPADRPPSCSSTPAPTPRSSTPARRPGRHVPRPGRRSTGCWSTAPGAAAAWCGSRAGDPGVFARLTEEIEAVRAAGIALRDRPGRERRHGGRGRRVGISLTERGRASMVVLATGADHHGTLPALDWDLLARAEGTLVFYMAVGTLEPITATLHRARPRCSRAGADRGARGLRRRARDRGRLGDIAERARRAGVTPPALLLVGPTVAAALGAAPEPPRRDDGHWPRV